MSDGSAHRLYQLRSAARQYPVPAWTGPLPRAGINRFLCAALKPSGPASSAENGDDQPYGARDERRDESPVVALAEAASHHGPERAQHHGVRYRDDGERGEGEDYRL